MKENKCCPVCGTTLKGVYDTGMVGCPACYQAFAKELKAVIREMHGKTEHVGKNPGITSVDYELIFEYDSLLSKKEKAILDGNPKRAAALDDELKQIARELENRGLR